MGTVVLAIALGAVVPLGLMALTAAGSRRRGNGLVVSGLAGLAFPLAWVAWYLRDERPYHH